MSQDKDIRQIIESLPDYESKRKWLVEFMERHIPTDISHLIDEAYSFDASYGVKFKVTIREVNNAEPQ